MSEHAYLTPEETEYIRHHSVRFGWTTESDTNRLIDDISALRAELKAAQEENRKNLELWDADAKDKDEGIARLRVRAENAEALFVNAANLDDCEEIRSRDRQLDRMRAAQPALPALARQMWPLLNRERGVLISRQVDGSITEEEARRLHDLQDFADRWVEAVAPRVEINPQTAKPESWIDRLKNATDERGKEVK